MKKSKNGGYLNLLIKLYNGRLFNRLLLADGQAKYNGEQGKILSALWSTHPLSIKEIAKITGLAKTSLTTMLRKLESQKLIMIKTDPNDSRKKLVDLTPAGKQQQVVGERVSQQLANIFYTDFSEAEIKQTEAYLERIKANLEQALEE